MQDTIIFSLKNSWIQTMILSRMVNYLANISQGIYFQLRFLLK